MANLQNHLKEILDQLVIFFEMVSKDFSIDFKLDHLICFNSSSFFQKEQNWKQQLSQ